MYNKDSNHIPSIPIKLTRPKLQNVYPRKRLFDILAEYTKTSAIWVCGPAGSGKTTLVNSFLHGTGIPCIWYDVDETDTDIASFFYYMGRASEQISPEKTSSLPLLTQEFFPGISIFTKRYFEIFFGMYSLPFAVVLDNYQAAGQETLLHEVVCTAIEDLQQNICFFICSREEPPPALARPRANCRIQLIGWNHLKLEKNEIEGVVKSIAGTSYPEKIISDLHQKIDGWIAALILLIKRGEFENMEPHMIAEQTPEEIFDYLGTSIFEKLEPEIKTILLKLCHISKISLNAAEILGGTRTPAILKALNKQNAFTYRTIDDPPEYHFHPLFREFLQKKAKNYFSSFEFQIIQSKSAYIVEQEEKFEEAVHLYIQSNHPMEAVELILTQAQMLSAQGRIFTLEKWINALPPEIVSEMPWLIFWKGACKIPVSPLEGRGLFEKALKMFEAQQDSAGCYIALSGIMDSITYQFNDFSELDIYIEKYSLFEKKFGEIESPEIQLKLTASMLNALVMRYPDSEKMYKWIERGWAILHMVKDVNMTLQIFMPLIILRIMQGNLPGADHLLKMFHEVSHEKASPLSYLVLQDLKSFHAWMSGRFEEGLTAARRGMAVEKETGINLIFLGLRTHGAASAIGLGKLELARELLEEITPFLDREGIWMQGLYHYIFFWLHLLLGNMAECRFHALASFEKETKAGNDMVLTGAHLMMAKMCYAQRKIEDAEKHIRESLRLCDLYGTIQDKFMALLTRGIFLLDNHQDDEAGMTLKEAFAIGREWDYMYGFLWHPREMARLCAEALKRNIEVAYVQSLVIKHNLITEKPPWNIWNWPWPVRIYSLGRFKIEIRGEELTFSRKAQQRPISMVKYLMAVGGTDIPEYRVQDALWPDSDGDAARNAYSTTLHRLRKLLDNKEALVHRGARISFNEHIVWTDTWAFESCCKKIGFLIKNDFSIKSTKGTQKSLSDISEELFKLYGGSFLPGEESLWAIPERERIKAGFLNTIQKTAQALENKGQLDEALNYCQKALSIEPLLESLYHKIMEIYGIMKNKNKVLEIYRQYEAVFRAEGLAPSQHMKSLKNSLL